jgi:hypothetical protein
VTASKLVLYILARLAQSYSRRFPAITVKAPGYLCRYLLVKKQAPREELNIVGTKLGTREIRVALIAAVVVGLGLAFAAGWYAHLFYVRAKLASLLPTPLAESPLASQSSSSGEADPTEDVADPNTEYSPSEKECPNVKKIGQTSPKSGPSRTKYFDTKTGQLLAHWKYPDAPKGIVQELKVNPEGGDDESMPMLGMPTFDSFNLPKNQGVSKLESKPGRYRFSFDPKENKLEYVVTVYECDPSGGEAANQA